MRNHEYYSMWGMVRRVAAACVVLAMSCGFVLGDQVVLKNGSSYKGKLISRNDQTVRFRVILANGVEIALDFPTDKVETVTIGDKEPPPKPKPPKPDPTPAPPVKPDKPKTKTPPSTGSQLTKRSASAVQAIIQRQGKTLPEWYDSVKLNYPRTLDLAGTNRVRGWQPQVNLGAYFFSRVTPRPSMWKSGIKLLHHVVDVRKNDDNRRAEAMGMLANYYLRYFEDYPRAAYWNLQSTKLGGRVTLHGLVGLAECYWRLGCTPLAESLLRKYRLDTQPALPSIKLWAELGQPARALKLATAMVRRAPDSGHLAAGNLHRLAGNYDKAIAHYDQAAAAAKTRRHGKRNAQRAHECRSAVKLINTLDLSKVASGTHSGTSLSYRGPLSVEVKVSAGKIVSAKVTRHKDDIFFSSLTKVPAEIVEKQSVEKLDAVSGATVTSEAIVNAATRALSSGMRSRR